MPFKSIAQQRYMNMLAKRGEISKKVIEEFNSSTNYKELPKKVNKKKTIKDIIRKS